VPAYPWGGHVVELIYVFDHPVIPTGSKVKGSVTQVDGASRKKRALAIANGNFSPLRTAHLDFDTLVLKDGTRLPSISYSPHLLSTASKAIITTISRQGRPEVPTWPEEPCAVARILGWWAPSSV
jgi:hypothetical protein